MTTFTRLPDIKGRLCNATAVTTGMSSSSFLEYARPHSHPPPTGRIGAYKVKNNIKSAASRDTTNKPHRIVADSLNNVPEDVNNHLPETSSLKRTIQRKRKIDTVTANPNLALACGRSLLLLQIPHHMWNVRDRSGTGSSRTTNALEAFHHTFNSLLTCQHPTIWKLLESLESQQNLSRSKIFKIGRGDSFRPSVQERRRNERIQNLVASYTQATADDLLRGIAYNYMM